eukprot:4302193-Prymnesium_polylepis.1
MDHGNVAQENVAVIDCDCSSYGGGRMLDAAAPGYHGPSTFKMQGSTSLSGRIDDFQSTHSEKIPTEDIDAASRSCGSRVHNHGILDGKARTLEVDSSTIGIGSRAVNEAAADGNAA